MSFIALTLQESAIENLLDPTHLQFVHEGQQGDVIGPRNVNYPEGTVHNIHNKLVT